ncbi:hypothetical protein Leryth_002222 [Lithospermum erythrorhizon]|nr:hypothetical protein Leryth_002222 [Lithospermum erythrorhizon]
MTCSSWASCDVCMACIHDHNPSITPNYRIFPPILSINISTNLNQSLSNLKPILKKILTFSLPTYNPIQYYTTYIDYEESLIISI